MTEQTHKPSVESEADAHAHCVHGIRKSHDSPSELKTIGELEEAISRGFPAVRGHDFMATPQPQEKTALTR